MRRDSQSSLIHSLIRAATVAHNSITLMAAGSIRSIALLGISAVMLFGLLTPTGAEENPARPSQPSLIVTPSTSMAFSWTSRWSVLIQGYRSLLDQDSILAHGQFNLWHNRHRRCHNHSYRERKCVTSFPRRIWSRCRVHERVKRSGQHDQAAKIDCPSIFASSCVGSTATIPLAMERWRLGGDGAKIMPRLSLAERAKDCNQPSRLAERTGKRSSFGSDRSSCSKYSIVFINPFCSCTLGSQASSFLAKLMSGQRCFGSSSGKGR
jgi:hypothetical protein